MNYQKLKKVLKEISSEQKAITTRRFFKTGKGDYAEEDVFIGVPIPVIRAIAKKFYNTHIDEILKLLKSQIHEERLLALIMMVNQFKKGKNKADIFHHYFDNRIFVNNWDLVDVSSPAIMGAFCLEENDHSFMDDLLESKRHWDRRMSIVATLSFIRSGQTNLTFEYAKILLRDKEDLMHKATGWMLREAGKKDLKGLKNFIQLHGKNMPRTMLRYAIEKFQESERQEILRKTKE